MVEIFHLLFLRAFGARVDKTLFSLKGGCNLRFFHRSVRYSEDMDLDIRTMSEATLHGNVVRVLGSQAFAQALRTQRIELVRSAAPKQTATTQRWKLMLRSLDSGAETPTKIEFSRRGSAGEVAVDAVDAAVIRAYRLYPVIVQHYTAAAAFAQKVTALALREQVQARDLFDLKLLLDAGGADRPLPAVAARHLPAAIDNAMAIDRDAFVGQVVAYLEPEFQTQYRSTRSWDTLQEAVVSALIGLQR